ncbi:MAG: tRNA adenosine(34) deaminase TadA [Acidobacteria bacterium]|nr:MAG: tRNA adenosine(34) deaminase TadA [Acidobacteriota bacterium]
MSPAGAANSPSTARISPRLRLLPENPKDELPTADAQPPTTASDEVWMQEALRSAQRALEAGEVPVGAVVVCNGNIVGRGWNRNITDSDPTAHAEILALREAGATVGNHRLGACELFVTIEPCAMCAGALVHARIKRLVYGADDPKAGAVHSVMLVVNHPQLNHQMEVRGGILAGHCAEMLQTFFKSRR